MVIKPSRKIENLPPYLFGAIDVLKRKAYQKNLDVIDLGMGNPDLPPPKEVVEWLIDTVKHHPRTFRYPQAAGMPRFRKTVAQWYKKRFGVELDPETEVGALIGSKEGIAHFVQAMINPGDVVLVPQPAYPVHFNSVILADGIPYIMPLESSKNFIVDIDEIPAEIRKKAKIMILNYPNNPTGAVCEDESFFEKVISFARENEIIIFWDNAYSEITFDNYVAPSFLQFPGAKEVGVEFHSISKTYNMAGWRVGWVCGNSEIISAGMRYKSYLDYGVPTFIQLAAARAIELPQDEIKKTVDEYSRRMDFFISKMEKLGWEIKKPKATMYLWTKIPPPYESMPSVEFAEKLLEETGIAVTPGAGFGKNGEGYIRIAMVTHSSRFHDAFLRLKKFLKR